MSIANIVHSHMDSSVPGYDWHDINPDFISFSSTIHERTDFEACVAYIDPVEPVVITEVPLVQQKTVALQQAAEFVSHMSDHLRRSSTTYDRLFSLMHARYLRKGSTAQTKFDDNKELFRPLVEACIRADNPVHLYLPAFPFKFPNPLKVQRRAPDMAEALCLSRFYEICEAFRLVYPPGATVTIVADGLSYAPMFGVTRHEALNYRTKLVAMIHRMGYDDRIDVVDQMDLVASQQERFAEFMRVLRPAVEEWWRRNSDDLGQSHLNSL